MTKSSTNLRKVLALIGAAGVLAMTANASFATETQWQKDHPRRTEVNKRLNHQDKRIHNEVKNGEISKSQAQQLHKEDRQIRGEERAMASQNGGHITKSEQHTLNQQENAVSKEIGHLLIR